MTEPKQYAWLIPGRLALAERPGGGGRSHRVSRREDELAWWHAAGITTIISAMRTRHGLLESALAGFRVHWHPLIEPGQGAAEIPRIVEAVRTALDRDEVVLVHADRPGEWTAAVGIALHAGLDLEESLGEAAAVIVAAGFPVGPLSDELLGSPVSSPWATERVAEPA